MGALLSVPAALCSGLCAVGSIISCCCTGGMGAGGVGPASAKFFYVLMLAMGTLAAGLIGRFGEDELERDVSAGDQPIFQFSVECSDITGQNVCSGDSAILRASFASVLFFALMFLGTVPTPTTRGEEKFAPLLGEGFHRGFWGAKILVYLALFVGSFFMGFFDDDIYTGVARFVAFFFLVLQVLVLIDFGYTWNDTWLDRSDIENDFADGSKVWLYALLAITFLLIGGSFAVTVVLFLFYKGCTEVIALTSVNLVLVVIFTGLTVFRENIVGEPAGISPAAVVTMYTTYLTFSAAQSNPSDAEECNPFNIELGENEADIFFGIILASLTLVYTAFTVSQNQQAILGGGRPDSDNTAGVTGAYEVEEADGTTRFAGVGNGERNDPEESTTTTDKLWFFHLLMISAAFYMAMILTNFGVSDVAIAEQGVGVGNISMYVKAGAGWAAALLFIWTLVAPAVMPDREF